MPRIPDYAAAGTSVAQARTPRFPADRSDQIRGEGQAALAGAITGAIDQAVEHDDKLRYAAARLTLLQEQAAVRKELEGDNDYESYEKRFRERTAKARSSAAANIRGSRSRELFEADAQADIERGVEQIRGQARAREVDQGIATLNGALETSRTTALESKDPIYRGAVVQAGLDAIDGAYKSGYIKESEAQATREKFKASYGEAFVSIQTPAERIEMLEKPEASVAKFIAPDRRAELLKAAKRDNDELRVRGESQAHFDGYMAKYGNNFRGALREAREELKADPLVRDATETRIAQEQARVETFEREDNEDAGEQAMQFLIGGGKFADLPLGLKNRLKPATLISLRNFAQSGGRTVSDPETLIQLSRLASDEQDFAENVNVLDFRSKLTDGDFQQYVDLQRKIRTGSVDGRASGFKSVNQVRDDKLKEFFGGVTAKTKQGQAKINDFVTKFEAAQRAFKQENDGKPIKSEDARKILDQLWSEVVIGEGLFGDSKKRAYELTDANTSVPQQDRDAIIQSLRRAGKPVSVEAIQQLYSRKPKSTTPITDAINEAERRARKVAP